MKETTGKRIRTIMNERNLKQVDILRMCEPFCSKFGIKLAKNDLSQYINDKVQPGQDKLSVLGLALNVSEAWLMGYDVPKERSFSPAAPSSNIAPVQLRQDEEILLTYYNRLNAQGQSKVTEYAADLADNERYIKDDVSEELNKVG